MHALLDKWAADKSLKGGSDEAKVAAIYRTFLDEATVEKLDGKPLQPMTLNTSRLWYATMARPD